MTQKYTHLHPPSICLMTDGPRTSDFNTGLRVNQGFATARELQFRVKLSSALYFTIILLQSRFLTLFAIRACNSC